MLKKILVGVLAIVLILSAGLFFWARSVLTKDGVRTALAAQISKAIGQPVSVGRIQAAIYPRVSVVLGDVTVGEPARIRVQDLRIGTDFRALLSRRIEHATLDLSGARVDLPLPTFTLNTGSESGERSSPVELVSIDAIVLKGVEIVSGQRTLTGDVELVPEGKGIRVRRISLGADGQAVEITGHITDPAGPVGELSLKSEALDFDQLVAFASDFAAGSGLASGQSSGPAAGTSRPVAPSARAAMNLAISLEAGKASMGTLTLDGLTGTARLTPTATNIDPVGFQVFGGRYTGALAFMLGDVPGFRLNATLSGIDVATAMAFAGSPGLMTGRLSAKLAMTGVGMDAKTVMNAARGTARIDITDGIVKNLGLVRSVVVATSGRTGTTTADLGSPDEPFTKIGTTVQIGGGAAGTEDLRFESANLVLSAAGIIALDGSRIDLAGDMQLSEELSKQAGRDLARYTQEAGRVTLPVTITGSADAPQVRPDIADMAKRALRNRASEEAQKRLKGLGGLFQR